MTSLSFPLSLSACVIVDVFCCGIAFLSICNNYRDLFVRTHSVSSSYLFCYLLSHVACIICPFLSSFALFTFIISLAVSQVDYFMVRETFSTQP